MDLNTEIRFLKGVGEKRAQQLNRLGVYSVCDLLYLFPRRYIDYENPYEISLAPYDTPCVVKATVLTIANGVRIKGGRTLYKVVCADNTARLNLVFFNSEYTVKKLQIGEDYLFYGKVGGNMLTREMTSPLFIPADTAIKQQPVYPMTQGINSNFLSKLTAQVFEQIGEIKDFLPPQIISEFELPSLDFALKNIHFGRNAAEISAAKERLIFDEFFMLQLGMALMGENNDQNTDVTLKNTDVSPFINSLSFTPTEAQSRVIGDILQGFKGCTAQNRLVQGDVGCGKTLVAAAAAFAMAQNKYQSCIMVPTEILANQHYKSFCQFFEKFNISVALLTSSTKVKEKRDILARLEDGEIDVIIGTHALISDNVKFHSLGLCITDEQHRFGVRQRTLVSQKGTNPHIIVMSATPIPRTLAMIIYGNMEISIIDQMPKGRKPVETYFVGTDLRARMFGFIDKHIKLGKQTYIVLPAVDPSEEITELQSVKQYCEEVVKPLLPHAKAEILHGKMKPAEKDAVMTRFKNGETDILCSTTVIEVGVDVPNAVLMIIENAERYGLSALHQLRGRVGRGSDQSYCILVSDHKGENVRERLKFMCSTQDGFKVSQYDLDHRGPGDFFGKRQHGLPDMKIASMSQDIHTLEKSQTACRMLLAEENWQHKYPLLVERLNKLFEGFVL
ncbi:MAG: ATP-dependent DNA helicase RecG [Oscillospiraceae bacterium]|nr:ATP-dependent DNA helicase RecG [Oscillospiraceae bacterium]